MVAKVEFHTGELFPRVGFVVTNLETPSRSVMRFYNKRGTAEQWIKEGKQAVKMTRLSCHRFRSNQVRLGLSPAGLQPGEFVAAAGVAQANRELVADQQGPPLWGGCMSQKLSSESSMVVDVGAS